MNSSKRMCTLESCRHIQDALKYLTTNSNVDCNYMCFCETEENQQTEKFGYVNYSLDAEMTVCSEGDYESNGIFNEFEQYEILSEVNQDDNDFDNLSKTINEFDLTNFEDNFLVLSEVWDETMDSLSQSLCEVNITSNSDKYEVLSEVGDDNKDDLSHYYITDWITVDSVDEINSDMISDNEGTSLNVDLTPCLPAASTRMMPMDTAINALVSKGPQGLLETTLRKINSEAAIDALLSLGRQGLLETTTITTENLQPYPVNRKNPVCKFFLKDECKYGSTGNVGGVCKFRHLSTNGLSKFSNGIRKLGSAPNGSTKRLKRKGLHQVNQWLTPGTKSRRH